VKDIEKILEAAVRNLKPLNPRLIILFGSYAWGEPDESSDIDLYVVSNDEDIPQNWKEKSHLYLKYSRPLSEIIAQIPADLIVHTKKMNQQFFAENSSFARMIREKGRILYESWGSKAVAVFSKTGPLRNTENGWWSCIDTFGLFSCSAGYREITQGIIDLGLELDLIKMLDALYIDSRYPGDFGLMPNGIPDLDDAKQFQELAENVFRDINNCVEG
jgi:uncharacterized protein